MHPRPVDDQRIQLLIPDRRLAEQFPQALLCVAAVGCEAIYELVRYVVQHVCLAGMSAIIPQRLTNIPLGSADDLLHFHDVVLLRFAQIQQTIEIAKVTKPALAVAVIAVSLFLTSCHDGGQNTSLPDPVVEKAQYTLITPKPSAPPIASVTPEIPWSDEDVEAMALTLAGECYEDKEQDKRLVCEVILNRVSAGNFGGDTVLAVVSAPNQFDGYWRQSRPVSENDYAVAEQALSDWYAGGCQPLSELLYFEAGENRENVFRSEY